MLLLLETPAGFGLFKCNKKGFTAAEADVDKVAEALRAH